MIGCGYWGPNLARVLGELAEVEVRAVCDLRRESALSVIRRHARGARPESDYRELLRDPGIDAVVVSTPVATHHEIARECLAAGKHLLVEKPLAMTVRHCEELIELAERHRVVLMVGHVFQYNVAVQDIKRRIDGGELGDIQYVYSRRVNLGRIQSDINALWSFAPHDVSILIYWLGRGPTAVSARGFSCLHQGLEDVVFATLEFPGGVGAHLHLSWLDPKKVREMTLVGSKRMIVYDDVSTDAKLQIYDKRVDRVEANQVDSHSSSFGEFQLQVRSGDLLIPYLRSSEPLREECIHFVECVLRSKRPRSDGQSGLRVVRVLEAANESLRAGGRSVRVEAESGNPGA